MKNFSMAAAALALAVPTSFAMPVDGAHAKPRVYKAKKRCRYSKGTTGLVAGGVGGAVVGSAVGGGVLGTVAGGVGGALAGRAIDRTITAKKRCR